MVALVRAGSYPKIKKNAGGGLGGRAQRLPPNALVARTALQMSTWRFFVVVVVVVVARNALQMLTWRSFVVVVVVVVVLGCCVPGFNCC